LLLSTINCAGGPGAPACRSSIRILQPMAGQLGIGPVLLLLLLLRCWAVVNVAADLQLHTYTYTYSCDETHASRAHNAATLPVGAAPTAAAG
jgi:hypothetical protein